MHLTGQLLCTTRQMMVLQARFWEAALHLADDQLRALC